MRSSQFKMAGLALAAALAIAAAVTPLVTAPSPWWVQPDFAQLNTQLRACETRFAEHRHCATARALAGQAMDALRGCLGEQSEVDGCSTVRRVASEQAVSLQELVHSTPIGPAPRLWAPFGVTLNQWVRAARDPLGASSPLGGLSVLVWLGLAGSLLLALRISYLRKVWEGLEGKSKALRTEVDELDSAERQFRRQVDWLNALQARLKALQHARHVKLLPGVGTGGSIDQPEAQDIRGRLDATFGKPPSTAPKQTGSATPGDAAWIELDPLASGPLSSTARRLLHRETGLVLRISCCGPGSSPHGLGGFWQFAVQLDHIEADLPHPRPVELTADFLAADWLALVPHERIPAVDRQDAMAAGKQWLEAVLRQEIEVEGGTLSTRVERHVRDQYSGVRRARARKSGELRTLRQLLAEGWYPWCLQHLFRPLPMVRGMTLDIDSRDA